MVPLSFFIYPLSFFLCSHSFFLGPRSLHCRFSSSSVLFSSFASYSWCSFMSSSRKVAGDETRTNTRTQIQNPHTLAGAPTCLVVSLEWVESSLRGTFLYFFNIIFFPFLSDSSSPPPPFLLWLFIFPFFFMSSCSTRCHSLAPVSTSSTRFSVLFLIYPIHLFSLRIWSALHGVYGFLEPRKFISVPRVVDT